MSKEATARSAISTERAMKLALEALEVDPFEMVEDADGHMVFLTNQAITALRQALANEALDKKAENARELGLDYEPAQQEPVQNNPLDCNVYLGSGKDYVIKHHVSYGPAQQEPVAWTNWRELVGARHYRTPGWEMYADKRNPDDVAIYTSPPSLSLAQRQARSADTWVGLTDEEILIMSRYDLEYAALIGEVQRKLKEKNA